MTVKSNVLSEAQKTSTPVAAEVEQPGGRTPTASLEETLEGYRPSAAGSTSTPWTGTEQASGAMWQRTT
jgi:hypothetical protein